MMLIGVLFSLIFGGFAAKKLLTVFNIRITPKSTFTLHQDYLDKMDSKIIDCTRTYEKLRRQNRSTRQSSRHRRRR